MASKGGVSEIAGRYATALFELADEAKQLDAVADDLRALSAMLIESTDLRQLVRSPVMSRADQGAAMAAILDKQGASDLTKKFIGHVAGGRRLFALNAMIRAYLEELANRRGEITADVTSARELSSEQVASVETALKKAVGGDVAVNLKVDSSLIGGLIVKVGSRMIDSSVSTKLQRLKLAMKGA